MASALRTVLAGVVAMAIGAGVAQAAETVLVPNRVIYPGETVEAAALSAVTLLEGKIAPADMAVALPDIEGKVAKRTLLPGRYVPINALRDAFLVDKGAAVEAVFVSGSLRISASAVTLTAGSAGDAMKVRNVDSGKILSGILMADGTVMVGGT